MSVPSIKTAIPLRRYQYGEFIITVLGDIESDDPVRYRYIMAVATEADPTPGLFLSCERGGADSFTLRASMADGSQVLGESETLGDQETFAREALKVVATMLDLSDEVPHRLM